MGVRLQTQTFSSWYINYLYSLILYIIIIRSTGRHAVQRVYGVEPDLTREGGSIPVTLTLQDVTGKNVMLLPIGQSDDGAHSQNEKIGRFNYIEGTKLFGSYFEEVGKI